MKQKSNDSKTIRIIMYAICAILAAFYLFVLYLGKNPNVGIEYRMYYLTHEMSEWPGFGKLSYTLGTKEYYNYKAKDKDSISVAVRKGTGWESRQENGIISSRTSADKAYLYYVLEETAAAMNIAISINNMSGSGKVNIYANGIFIGNMTYGKTEYEYTIPAECMAEVSDNLLTISFELEDSRFSLNSIVIR